MQLEQGSRSGERRAGTMHALQCARGVAALLVVYYHASAVAVPGFSMSWTGDALNAHRSIAEHIPVFGACGVDLFFVLSGYIIWTSTKPATSTLAFYKRRAARVVPLYWLVTLAVGLAVIVTPAMFHTLRFSPMHFLASLAFVPWQNPAFSTSDPGAFTPLVVAGWTLNFEIMFYVLFGLVTSRRSHRLKTTIGVYLSFILLISLLKQWLPPLRFYDPFLIAEFLAGCLIAATVEREHLVSPKLAIIVLLSATTVLLIDDYAFSPANRFFTLGLPAAAVVYALAALELKNKWPRVGALEKVGDASYSIYLTHIFALAGLRILWRPASHQMDLLSFQTVFTLTVLATATILGLLSYRFLERPLTKQAQKLLSFERKAKSRGPVEEPASSGGLALRIP